MADQAVTQDLGDVEIEVTPRGGLNGKKLVLFIILPLLLLLSGIGGAYFAGLLDPLLGGERAPAAEQHVPVPQPVFFDLPQMLVNLNTGGKNRNYLKIAISLELTNQEDSVALQNLLPRVVDNLQVHLRELRGEDLRGSAGVQRPREERKSAGQGN